MRLLAAVLPSLALLVTLHLAPNLPATPTAGETSTAPSGESIQLAGCNPNVRSC